MSENYNRRQFVKDVAASGLAISTINAPLQLFASPKKDVVRIGMIATGLRGQSHLEEFLKRNDVEVVAMADPDKGMMADAQKLVAQYKKKAPAEYTNGNYDYRNLLKRDDVDAVIIASPWEWHIEQAIDAMHAGKIAGVEVCGAIKLQDCFDVVKAHEQTKVPIMMMENVCYRRDIMAVLNMVQKGMFGELLHLHGGYSMICVVYYLMMAKHLTTVVLSLAKKVIAKQNGERIIMLTRNGELYPTHGLGPVATMIDINRGNRLTALSSVSTKAKGLHRYIVNYPGVAARIIQMQK